MGIRTLVRAMLLVFVAGSIGIWLSRRDQTTTEQIGPTQPGSSIPVAEGPSKPGAGAIGSPESPTSAAAAATPATRDRVVVTYFTTDVRCVSCRTIEELSRRAVEAGFPDEVATGTVSFRVVNTDRQEHAHFVEHYALTNKVVIVSREQAGREMEWVRCQDVWTYFKDPERFFAYLREPIRNYLQRS